MNRKPLILIAVVILVAVLFFGALQLQGRPQPAYSADVVSALNGGGSTEGYARALTSRQFSLPADYAAHPEYQAEWWYYTGDLATEDGRRFGFQFTLFRRALSPTMPQRQSDWATNQLYFAHFTVSDVSGNQFFSKELFSRGAAGLAGVTLEPRWRAWIQNWQISAVDDKAETVRLQANEGEIAVDLTMRQIKPMALHGDHGLSPKGSEPGNASYYFSLTRLPTTGMININGTGYRVTGNSWLDREWSTSALGKDAIGWDWISIQLDNGRELAMAQVRNKDGSIEPASHGSLIEADGTVHPLKLSDFKIDPISKWTSPRSGGTYPSGWNVTVQASTGPIQLNLEPLLRDQELNVSVAYWEGAVKISGTDGSKPVQGFGYVELTGYAQPASGITNTR